jgi:hypothetical protein
MLRNIHNLLLFLGTVALASAGLTGCVYEEGEDCGNSTQEDKAYLNISIDMSSYLGEGAALTRSDYDVTDEPDTSREENTTAENTVKRIDVVFFEQESPYNYVKSFIFLDDASLATNYEDRIGSFSVSSDGNITCSPKVMDVYGDLRMCVYINGDANATSYSQLTGLYYDIPDTTCDKSTSYLMKYYVDADVTIPSSGYDTPSNAYTISGLKPLRTCSKLRVNFTNMNADTLYSDATGFMLTGLKIKNFMRRNFIVPGSYSGTASYEDLDLLSGTTGTYYKSKFSLLDEITSSAVADTIQSRELFNCYISDYNGGYGTIDTTMLELTFTYGSGSDTTNFTYDIPFYNSADITAIPAMLTANSTWDFYTSNSYSYNKYMLLRNFIYEWNIVYHGESKITFYVTITPWDEETRELSF